MKGYREMIKCSKCGAELSDDAKFCSYCGNKIEVATPSPIKTDEGDILPDVPQQESGNGTTQKSDILKYWADKIKGKASEKWHKLSTYGKIATIAIIAFALLCLIAFLFGKTAAAVIAILQIVLTVVAILIKRQIIKIPQNWLHLVALILAVVLLVPYVSLFGADYGDAEKFAWSDILLADVIPKPKSHLGEILANSDECLSLDVYKTSTRDYKKYVDACAEKGFTVESEQSESSYYAYNADGYKLSLYYDENDSEMNINVDSAKKYGTLVWPDSTITRLLPVPKSTTGEITQDDEKGFAAYVSDTPMEEFDAYVVACADKGFTVDATKSEKSYSAKNSDGYQLSVSYQGNSVISISVNAPEYTVSLEIECVENLIFSKYDVDVYIDDSLQGTINHGTTETYDLKLTKGVYKIKFVSADDNEVMGSVDIDIHQNELLKYKISCMSTQIDVETIKGTIAEHGDDEAPMPQAASDFKYKNYVDVQQELTDAGFTNVSFNILYDIVLGWTEEGEVDNVSVDGRSDFEKNEIFKKDVPIVITYHMKAEDDPSKPVESEPADTSSETSTASVPEESTPAPEPAQNLTAENCPDLAALLKLSDPADPSVASFASQYFGQTIEFDGCITFLSTHENYTTRFDVLIGAGDYDANHQVGPYFHLTNVNFNDMNVTGGDSVYTGLNVHVVAEVGNYDSDSELFELDIISMQIRD